MSLKLNVQSVATQSFGGIKMVEITDKASPLAGLDKATDITLNCIKLNIQKADAPVGKPIEAYYSLGSSSQTFRDRFDNPIYESNRIPVYIVENNITYKLISLAV